MVEANATTDSHGQHHGILKHTHEGAQTRHVQFDEVEIAAYDAQRGQCMPIDDPKTPFHEENHSDEDMKEGEEEVEIDPELAAHLNEAKQNLAANAVCTSGVRRALRPGEGAAAQSNPSLGGGIDPAALASRLQ